MDNGGSTLIEALFATALVAVALSPSILAFRAQLAAEDRIRASLAADLALERAALEAEPTPPPRGAAEDENFKAKLSVTDETPCGRATLVRSVLKMDDGSRSVRERVIYQIRGDSNGPD